MLFLNDSPLENTLWYGEEVCFWQYSFRKNFKMHDKPILCAVISHLPNVGKD